MYMFEVIRNSVILTGVFTSDSTVHVKRHYATVIHIGRNVISQIKIDLRWECVMDRYSL